MAVRLRVCSANRFIYRGPGRLDVSLSAGVGLARTFAPPKELLDPCLAERERAKELLKRAERFRPAHNAQKLLIPDQGSDFERLTTEAWAIEDAAWASYAPAFRACMRVVAGLRKDRSETKWGELEDRALAMGVEPCPEAFRAVLAGAFADPDVDGVPITSFVCWCAKPFRHHCHSRILCELFASFPGVEDGGEAE